MFCNLCGANIPDGSPHCSKCKNFFPKNLGAYYYKIVLASFSDYNAKKETAKFLASRTPGVSLSDIIKRLDSLPLVIAKKVDGQKARQLEQTLTRMGARVRFVPVIRDEAEKSRLIAEIKKPLKRSYTEGKPLFMPSSVRKLESETKSSYINLKFIMGAIVVLLGVLFFFILPQYYTSFYEQQKNKRESDMTRPTPESPLPGRGGTPETAPLPPDIIESQPPPVTIPELIPSVQDPAAAEGISLYQRGLYDLAINKFLEALKRDPEDSTLKRNIALSYLALGWNALNAEDLDGAEKHLTDCLSYSEEYQAYEGLGYIAEKNKDLASAETYYLTALNLNPKAEEILLALGIVYYYEEKLDLSLETLTRYAKTNSTDETAKYYIAKIKRENPVESALDTRETGHFIVKYSGTSKNLVGDFLLPILEEAYSIVGGKLGYYPDHKITVILYTDEEFKTATDSPGWAGAIFDGKIRIPIKGAKNSTDLLKRMVIHEYTHAVVFDISGPKCPAWLNEGLAQLFEGSSVDSADLLVIDYLKLKGKNLPLKNLTNGFINMPADSAYTAYMMSLSATGFLTTKYGMSSTRAILSGIRSGKTVDQAILSALSVSYDDFIDRWAVYLQNRSR